MEVQTQTETTNEIDVDILIDRYIAAKNTKKEIEAQLAKVNKVVTALETDFRSLADDLQPEENMQVANETHTVVIDAQRKKVIAINKNRLMKILGAKTWFNLTVPGVTDIRKYLNPEQIGKVLTEEHTGNRTVRLKENK